jgi:NUC153 domain
LISQQKLPQVNKDLALKLMEQKKVSEESKKKKKQDGSLLADDRFKALFENTDFEVDTKTEDFR